MLELIEAVAQRKENPVRLSEEQKDFLLVVAAQLEEILHFKKRPSESIDPSERPQQAVMLLHGQGGSGKTEVVLILRQIMARFKIVVEAVAATNSAARVIQGDTVHSALILGQRTSLNLRALDRNVGSELVDRWQHVDALIIEELSMVAPKMLGALSFRTCVARRQKCGARPDLYTLPGFAFGGIPLVILLGDFMQLAPLDNNVRKSLLKEPQPPKPR